MAKFNITVNCGKEVLYDTAAYKLTTVPLGAVDLILGKVLMVNNVEIGTKDDKVIFKQKNGEDVKTYEVNVSMFGDDSEIEKVFFLNKMTFKPKWHIFFRDGDTYRNKANVSFESVLSAFRCVEEYKEEPVELKLTGGSYPLKETEDNKTIDISAMTVSYGPGTNVTYDGKYSFRKIGEKYHLELDVTAKDLDNDSIPNNIKGLIILEGNVITALPFTKITQGDNASFKFRPAGSEKKEEAKKDAPPTVDESKAPAKAPKTPGEMSYEDKFKALFALIAKKDPKNCEDLKKYVYKKVKDNDGGFKKEESEKYLKKLCKKYDIGIPTKPKIDDVPPKPVKTTPAPAGENKPPAKAPKTPGKMSYEEKFEALFALIKKKDPTNVDSLKKYIYKKVKGSDGGFKKEESEKYLKKLSSKYSVKIPTKPKTDPRIAKIKKLSGEITTIMTPFPGNGLYSELPSKVLQLEPSNISDILDKAGKKIAEFKAIIESDGFPQDKKVEYTEAHTEFSTLINLTKSNFDEMNKGEKHVKKIHAAYQKIVSVEDKKIGKRVGEISGQIKAMEKSYKSWKKHLKTKLGTDTPSTPSLEILIKSAKLKLDFYKIIKTGKKDAKGYKKAHDILANYNGSQPQIADPELAGARASEVTRMLAALQTIKPKKADPKAEPTPEPVPTPEPPKKETPVGEEQTLETL